MQIIIWIVFQVDGVDHEKRAIESTEPKKEHQSVVDGVELHEKEEEEKRCEEAGDDAFSSSMLLTSTTTAGTRGAENTAPATATTTTAVGAAETTLRQQHGNTPRLNNQYFAPVSTITATSLTFVSDFMRSLNKRFKSKSTTILNTYWLTDF